MKIKFPKSFYEDKDLVNKRKEAENENQRIKEVLSKKQGDEEEFYSTILLK